MIQQNKCPICKSSSIKKFLRDEVVGHGHYPFQKITKYFFTAVVFHNPVIKKLLPRTYFLDIRKCEECNHLFQHKIFDPKGELEFHKAYYEITGIDDGFRTSDYDEDKANRDEIDFISSTFNGKTILDIGANTGEFCELARESNIVPTALERGLKAVDFLKSKDIECFEDSSEINKKFDIIRTSHVLSHMQHNIVDFINSLISKLNDNGIIYFIDHLNNNEENLNPILSPLLHVNLFCDNSFDLLIDNFPSLSPIDHDCKAYNKNIFLKIYRRI